MNRVTGIFLEDWRRKLLALGISILIWSWVEGQIAVEVEVQFSLAQEQGESLTPQDFVIQIQAPEGWVLTDPKPGDSVLIRLHGSGSEIAEFRGNQCAASFRAPLRAEPNRDRIEVPITPEQLDWLRPRDADFLLRGVQGAQQLQSLTFERVEEQTILLTEHDVPVGGAPAEAFEAQPEMMSFLPKQVTVTGPKFAVEQLLERLADAHSPTGTLSTSALLRPLQIEPNTRSDVRASLGLHPDLERLGIRMDPPRVDVRIPVVLRDENFIEWLPDAVDLLILPADDEASNGPWTHEPWVPTKWKVSLPGVEAELLNMQWIRDHVQLILPMNTLSAASLDTDELRIEAKLFGLSSDDDKFYRKHIVIEPMDAQSAVVKVTRNP